MPVVNAKGIAKCVGVWVFIASQTDDAAAIWAVFSIVEEDKSRVETGIPNTDVECPRNGKAMMPCVGNVTGQVQEEKEAQNHPRRCKCDSSCAVSHSKSRLTEGSYVTAENKAVDS